MNTLDQLLQQNQSIQLNLHLNYDTMAEMDREEAIAKLCEIGQAIQALQSKNTIDAIA